MKTPHRTILLLALGACSEPAAEGPRRVLRPVVGAAIEELEREVPAPAPRPELAAKERRELTERVQGFLRDLGRSQGSMRELILEDLSGLGDEAVPELVAGLRSPMLDAQGRAGALEILGLVGTRAAAEALLVQVEGAPESWIRAHAAWHLSKTDQDWVVPRLLLRLKYENDHDAVIWIAFALARFKNYAGLDGLSVVAANAVTDDLRASAAARRQEIGAEVGVDPDELGERWHGRSHAGELPEAAPSALHRLEVWRQLTKLSGEHFQLRGVDDARFVLSRGAAWVAGILARALEDVDVYTRVHTAQCIERMGPRGAAAGPALLASLEDPVLAPNAADALGGIAHLEAEPALADRLGPPHELGLRVACARALGRLGKPSSVAALRPLLAQDVPRDLRQAAAEALLAIGLSPEIERTVVPMLVDGMTTGDMDNGSAERAVGRWLASRAAGGDEAAASLLERWRALDRSIPNVPPTPEESAERQEGRRALVEGELDRFLGE